MNKPIKWSPAFPIRKPDNIISSSAKPSFIPSYESEATENMKFIMSNEYMRIWFKEKLVYERDTYAREQIIKKERKIKRRIIQRMMTFREPSKNNFIEDYVEKKMGRSKSEDEDQIKKKLKYKPACQESQIIGISKSKTKGRGTKNNKDNGDECDSCACEIVVRPIKIRQTG